MVMRHKSQSPFLFCRDKGKAVLNEDEPSDDISDDEGQLPPEHYLAQAKSLNVSQLRQQRYSDGTQEKLDETRMYWDR
ncbi:hypothetical protein ACHE_10198S [Aspergillus chevalieri]|uniref:Uncharacterized protein n=1 Tax=Aspergillus chevalieri TaxID=182096 RepID=A0A7R7VDP2_ASPCH|nr:uncharacterized protein ACHE_10198S [Aspergillus chevalieri]BCR82796.1 hypothetical protein ACHE_10198S [Aspergillus chevalieri]